MEIVRDFEYEPVDNLGKILGELIEEIPIGEMGEEEEEEEEDMSETKRERTRVTGRWIRGLGERNSQGGKVEEGDSEGDMRGEEEEEEEDDEEESETDESEEEEEGR